MVGWFVDGDATFVVDVGVPCSNTVEETKEATVDSRYEDMVGTENLYSFKAIVMIDKK